MIINDANNYEQLISETHTTIGEILGQEAQMQTEPLTLPSGK